MLTATQRSSAASVVRNGCGDAVSQQFSSLAHWLRVIGDLSGVVPKTIGVTSCEGGTGVSTVAANLAIATAQNIDQPVLLLDLSTTRPSVAVRFAMSGDLGLIEALSDIEHAGDYVTPLPIANLSVLGVNRAGAPQQLNLETVSLNGLLRSLEKDFGFIVLDLPVVESSVCFVAAGLLNGILLVMETERTRSATAARAKQRLIDARASVLGVVLNKHPQHLPRWLESRI